MKVIVGLGNPGLRYAKTRHNLGFWVIDELSTRWQIPLTKHKFQAKYGEGLAQGEKVVLVKPQTFMNRSGESVRGLVDFYQLELTDLLVIYDDLALQPGILRIKGAGSAGGHNGVDNIINHLKTTEFPRLRVGIGSVPPFLTSADYVLQGIGEGELKILEDACQEAADAIELWLKSGLLPVMNQYNRKQTNGT
ncbi:MAG: aminoacyl-tRNA hydrolase [Firmicutes bacterium]|nr:aminoacyl-tRNA hydrolase [Bacillota bacterium]